MAKQAKTYFCYRESRSAEFEFGGMFESFATSVSEQDCAPGFQKELLQNKGQYKLQYCWRRALPGRKYCLDGLLSSDYPNIDGLSRCQPGSEVKPIMGSEEAVDAIAHVCLISKLL